MLKTIKNKLNCLCAEEIVTSIVSEYKESSIFSIFADEDRDDVPKLTRCQFWECESGTSGQELCLSTIVFTANFSSFQSYVTCGRHYASRQLLELTK